jgi:UDP-3-O-[3-hydroxymyristoyl] glucosamine N-acyltransferase
MSSATGAAAAVRLGELVAALGGELQGDPDLLIERIASLASADVRSISFLAQARLRPQLELTRAGCVIVRPDLAEAAVARGAAIITPDPYLYYARLTRWWVAHHQPTVLVGVHASALVAEGVQMHPSASVGPFTVVDAGAVIGEGVRIGAQCHVGRDANIGAQSQLAARVSFGAGCRIGERGVIHSGAVIGADGFGFAPFEGRWEKIEQLGAVVMGHDVDVGANTCIDRGALDDTVIEDGVKLDNLIQIAHNVHIGRHTAMAGCVGVAGSAHIGAHCTFGGAAMILGHLEIADHVHVSAASCVMSSILTPGQYSGVFPIDAHGDWEKNAATLRQLHLLRSRLRTLEKKSIP